MKNKQKKIKKTWTLEAATVAIIEGRAKKEKRNENSTVDLLIQEAAKIIANS